MGQTIQFAQYYSCRYIVLNFSTLNLRQSTPPTMSLLVRQSGLLIIRTTPRNFSKYRSQAENLATKKHYFTNSRRALHTSRMSQKERFISSAGLIAAATSTSETAFDFTVTDIDGKNVDLNKFRGKVVLVVNVASQCGFTPQYKELGDLYNRYKDQGLVILGFPCNQFGGQEPADNRAIKKFAEDRGAKFPMMAKVDVNGAKSEPLYSFLKSKQGGFLISDIKWNFTKFLISKEGEVVKRYGSATTPLAIEKDIQNLL